MSAKKYVIPVVMGRPAHEIFLMNGTLDVGQKTALVRLVTERSIIAKDEKNIQSLIKTGKLLDRPSRIKEVEIINLESIDTVSKKEAALIYGYIHNTLPGAFKAPEMSKWFLYEKPNDITPLKMARFSINLLRQEERIDLIGWMSGIKMETNDKQLAAYR